MFKLIYIDRQRTTESFSEAISEFKSNPELTKIEAGDGICLRPVQSGGSTILAVVDSQTNLYVKRGQPQDL